MTYKITAFRATSKHPNHPGNKLFLFDNGRYGWESHNSGFASEESMLQGICSVESGEFEIYSVEIGENKVNFVLGQAATKGNGLTVTKITKTQDRITVDLKGSFITKASCEFDISDTRTLVCLNGFKKLINKGDKVYAVSKLYPLQVNEVTWPGEGSSNFELFHTKEQAQAFVEGKKEEKMKKDWKALCDKMVSHTAAVDPYYPGDRAMAFGFALGTKKEEKALKARVEVINELYTKRDNIQDRNLLKELLGYKG